MPVRWTTNQRFAESWHFALMYHLKIIPSFPKKTPDFYIDIYFSTRANFMGNPVLAKISTSKLPWIIFCPVSPQMYISFGHIVIVSILIYVYVHIIQMYVWIYWYCIFSKIRNKKLQRNTILDRLREARENEFFSIFKNSLNLIDWCRMRGLGGLLFCKPY